jgi:hypothetical protein
LDSPERTEIFPDNPDGARGLRDHALADHFDAQAQTLDLAEPAGGTEVPACTQNVAR